MDATDISAILGWLKHRTSDREIRFRPARVLMPDSSGIPFLGDMRRCVTQSRDSAANARRINPVIPVSFVVDHSVAVYRYGSETAAAHNMVLELEQNRERYEFLRWASQAFENLAVVPPGSGICHQINLELLARVVWTRRDGEHTLAYPDSLVGMDSHTAMINGLGVAGWGVGGLESGTAALGEPISILVPEVVGCHLTGRLRPGVTSTVLVLTIHRSCAVKTSSGNSSSISAVEWIRSVCLIVLRSRT